MLNTFRKGGVVQFFMGVVILLIIAAFALDYRGSGSTSFKQDCVAEVRGECVAPRDFTSSFSLSVPDHLTPKQLRQLGMRKIIVDGLVERELLLAEARRMGISVSEEAVDAELALGRVHYSWPAAQDARSPMLTYIQVRNPKTEAFDYEIYQRSVRNVARMSGKDFKANQTEEIIASRMRDIIRSGVRMSEAEAWAQYEHGRAKATVRVAQVPWTWFARFQTAPTDDSVQTYLAANTPVVDAEFTGKEAVYVEGCPLVSEIFFALPPAADADDEAATRARAEGVAARATSATSAQFEGLARLYSAAPSAYYGGKRGCIAESEGEEAAQLIKALEGVQPGTVAKLVQVPRGFYLLRLEGRLGKDEAATVGKLWVARPLAARAAGEKLAREFSEGLLGAVKSGQGMQEAVDALTDNALKLAPELFRALPKAAAAKAPADELRTAALEVRERPRVEISPNFARGDVVSPIPNATAGASVKELAFTLASIGDVHPEPIPTRDGFALMQLKEKEAAKREDFDKSKAEILRELKERAQSDALNAYVDRLRQTHAAEIQVNEQYLVEKESAADDT